MSTTKSFCCFSKSGKAYGIFNVKKLYLASVVIFEAGSAMCGAAPNMSTMIVGRVIAGLGGNGMYSGCLTCRLYPSSILSLDISVQNAVCLAFAISFHLST